MQYDVVVIGAGAAGLVAAARAAERGRRTLLLEKNRQPGVKILMSGGTRCNITHHTDNRGIATAYGASGRFLHSPLAAFSVEATLAMFHRYGVPTKTEETGKIFPVSDRASDVLDALLARLMQTGAELSLQEPVTELTHLGDGFTLTTPRRIVSAANVIITTGGRSYPGSGTCGDGYAWAAACGHTIRPTYPALTPLVIEVDWVRDLKGLTIGDVSLRVLASPADGAGKVAVLDKRRDSFLFTHFGVSGPAALDISRVVSRCPEPRRLRLECDFRPDVNEQQLDATLQSEQATAGKKQAMSVLSEIVPRRLAEALARECEIAADQRFAELGRKPRLAFVQHVKRLSLPISGTKGYGKAEVTAGGVALEEVDSATMQSKLTPGLYLAGEVLDLDGPIGGYNFQAAWSTGYLAGDRA